MTTNVLIGLVMGLVMGVAVGWTANFVLCYVEKKNLRWTWLLYKPTPLSDDESHELTSLY